MPDRARCRRGRRRRSASGRCPGCPGAGCHGSRSRPAGRGAGLSPPSPRWSRCSGPAPPVRPPGQQVPAPLPPPRRSRHAAATGRPTAGYPSSSRSRSPSAIRSWLWPRSESRLFSNWHTTIRRRPGSRRARGKNGPCRRCHRRRAPKRGNGHRRRGWCANAVRKPRQGIGDPCGPTGPEPASTAVSRSWTSLPAT